MGEVAEKLTLESELRSVLLLVKRMREAQHRARSHDTEGAAITARDLERRVDQELGRVLPDRSQNSFAFWGGR